MNRSCKGQRKTAAGSRPERPCAYVINRLLFRPFHFRDFFRREAPPPWQGRWPKAGGGCCEPARGDPTLALPATGRESGSPCLQIPIFSSPEVPKGSGSAPARTGAVPKRAFGAAPHMGLASQPPTGGAGAWLAIPTFEPSKTRGQKLPTDRTRPEPAEGPSLCLPSVWGGTTADQVTWPMMAHDGPK